MAQSNDEPLRVNGLARDYGEIRTVDEALKLEGVLSKQQGEMYILTFADWCGHCQTYKPFWERLRNLSTRMIPLAAVQDTQLETIKSLKTAPLNGYPTVIHVKKDGSMEAVDSTEMRDEEKMEALLAGPSLGARVTDNGHLSKQQVLRNGGPIAKILQVGAGLLTRMRKRWRLVHAARPMKTRKPGKKRASRRNLRTRKVKRAGRRL